MTDSRPRANQQDLAIFGLMALSAAAICLLLPRAESQLPVLWLPNGVLLAFLSLRSGSRAALFGGSALALLPALLVLTLTAPIVLTLGFVLAQLLTASLLLGVLPGARPLASTRHWIAVGGLAAIPAAAILTVAVAEEAGQTFVTALLRWLAESAGMSLLVGLATLARHAQAPLNSADARQTRYSALLATTSDGFIRADHEGRILEANQAYADRSGYSIDELQRLRVFDLRANPDPEPVRAQMRGMRAGDNQVFESRHRRKDGSLWDVEVSLCYLDVGAGEYCAFIRNISESKLAAQRLRQSEALLEESSRRLTIAVESAGIGIWDYHIESEQLYWDDQMFALYSTSRDVFGGRLEDWRSRLHSDDRDRVWAALEQALQADSTLDVEFRTESECGQVCWLRTFARIERRLDGSPIRLTGVSYDISERYRREYELWDERQRFQDLVDSTDGIVWEADVQTDRFTFVSAKAERLLGYPLAAWYRANFWIDHLHPDDRQRIPAYSQSEIDALRAHDLEYRLQAADGRWVWLRDIVSVVADGGMPRLLRGVMVDITEQRRAQQMAEAVAERLKLALHAGGIGIWEVDLETGAQDWDAQMYRLFERPEGEDPRDVLATALDDEGLARARSAHEQARQGDFRYQHEYRVRLPAGGHRYLKVQAAVLPDPSSGRRRLVGATWDCSAQRQLEQDLRSRQQLLQTLVQEQTLTAVAAQQRAERAANLQAEFLANVSHELRTPLHVIIGFINLADEQLLEDATPQPRTVESVRSQLARSSAAARRLLALVDDLLDLAKLESGRMELRLEAADLMSLLGTALDELTPLLVARHLQVERHVEGTALPAIRVDERRVIQVLRNVLANAARFSPEYGRIEVCARAVELDVGSGVELVIDDEGSGVPEDEVDSIFDKFVQGSRTASSKTGGNGTGLGLPIAREIMRAHGGEIVAEHRPGHGARFVMRFHADQPTAVPPTDLALGSTAE